MALVTAGAVVVHYLARNASPDKTRTTDPEQSSVGFDVLAGLSGCRSTRVLLGRNRLEAVKVAIDLFDGLRQVINALRQISCRSGVFPKITFRCHDTTVPSHRYR